MLTSKWQKRFFELAILVASWSKDRSTKVGAVIVDDEKRVIQMGYNGMPSCMDDEDDTYHERPIKYDFFEHAERNAIFNAVKRGISLDGTTIIMTLFPCADCTRAIIQSGIKCIITKKPDFDNKKWAEKWKNTLTLLEHSNIELIYVEFDINQLY